MKQSAPILTLAGFMAILSSCATSLYVPKYYGPEIIPSEKPATIVFINNFDYTNQSIVTEKNQGTYASAARLFSKSFTDAFKDDDSIKTVVGDTLRKETGAGMLTTLLPLETIADACRRYNGCMLVALDSINIGFYSEDDFIDSFEGWVNIYSRKYYLFAEFFLSAYSPDGDLVNRSSVDGTYYYSWRLALISGVALNPSVAGAERKIDRIAAPCAANYAAKFFSLTENEERKVYKGEPLTESYNLMKSGQWEDAIKVLEPLTRSADQSVAKKAKINLSVAEEGEESRKIIR